LIRIDLLPSGSLIKVLQMQGGTINQFHL
jgi:hypothetical protein